MKTAQLKQYVSRYIGIYDIIVKLDCSTMRIRTGLQHCKTDKNSSTNCVTYFTVIQHRPRPANNLTD